jgi:hypothetical protein
MLQMRAGAVASRRRGRWDGKIGWEDGMGRWDGKICHSFITIAAVTGETAAQVHVCSATNPVKRSVDKR